MNQWTKLIAIIEDQVLNTTLDIYEIIAQIKVDHDISVGFVAMYDALNALRVKYVGIVDTTQRINDLISKRKTNRENTQSIDAYNSTSK